MEWVGGLVSVPAYVTGEGEPYRPEMLLWMIPQGPVLGMTTAKPGELLDRAADHFRDTMRKPMIGRPHVPARVRVASPELASMLGSAVDSRTEIVCAPTPELEEVLAGMREDIGNGEQGEQSYLTSEIDADATASLFRAAAALFRAKPWSVVPDDESILSVTIEALGVREAAVSVIGQMGQSHGFIVFSNAYDFDTYLEAAEDGEGLDDMPPHFALTFDRGAELSPPLRKEIAVHGWEIAAPKAYPSLFAVDEDAVGRPPTAKELTITEAIAIALTDALAEKDPPLARAWSTDRAFSRTSTVATHAGPIEITLGAPYDAYDDPRTLASDPIPDDVLAALAELDADADGDEIDDERRIELEDELAKRFCASPEAQSLTDIQSCHFVMNLAAEHLGKTIASLDARDLREILFEIIPRKVSIDASKASWIVEENRAFFAFLKREYGFEQADACLRVLGVDAAKKLERALSDRRNFGMAKSLMMAGRDAGFDVSTKEGIEAWMGQIQGMPIPPSITHSFATPTPRVVDPAAARARKNKRKSERKARKKNR